MNERLHEIIDKISKMVFGDSDLRIDRGDAMDIIENAVEEWSKNYDVHHHENSYSRITN